MAASASNECSEATRVLLVDPQSLPVLLQGDPQGNAGDIPVDLLQQALQGAAGIQDDDATQDESAEEVSLDALAVSGVNNDNEVVAIYQGEGGQTHTIKISLAEAQSLGLQFTNDSFPESLSNGTLVEDIKGNHLAVEQGGTNGSIALNNGGLLQGVACSNVTSEGRIIDTDGNIVETTEALQILPASLSSYLSDGLNHSLSLVQQYDLDGTVTYAVKLKDQNDTVMGTDYHILEPDSSAKTGLDIEEELKEANLKQNILQSSQTIPAESIGLTASVTLNNDSNAIQVPISTLEALSKQIILPASNSSVPISVTLAIPTETSVQSQTPIVSSSDLSSTTANKFYQIVTNRNNVISSGASTPFTTLVPQQSLTVNQQHSQLASSAALLNVQNTAAVALLSNNRNIAPRIDKLPTLLPAPKGMSNSGVKTITALKKQHLSTNVISPAVTATSSVHTPAMASVAPITTQPNLGTASSSKSLLLNNRTPSSNSNSTKPLGSSENPIQLVQQGQTFHSMQALSQAQLRQIATVLQQKHLSSNSTETKNVLFDEQTKTRIVYRVVYPEDVDLQQPSSPTGGPGSMSAKSSSRVKGRRGRPVRSKRSKQPGTDRSSLKAERGFVSEDPATLQVADNGKEVESKDDSTPAEEAPKIDKKKASGSRTRSGRVIRPPKHMMKDFKRLHYTDFKERDGNDSDGGYSDYSNPEQPVETPPQKEVEVELLPVKKKISRFSCPTCQKLYLGLGRMEKHFQQHPDHGCFEEFKKQLFASTPGGATNEETSGEAEAKASISKSNVAKGKKRSQSSSQLEKERAEVRKRKLKLALQACDVSEIIEVAGPLIARYSSLWDLLLLRLMAEDEKRIEKDNNAEIIEVNKNGSGKPVNADSLDKPTIPVKSLSEDLHRRSTSNRVQWLLMELGSLADTLQSLATELFQPAMMHGDKKDHIEINKKTVSGLLGVSCGVYRVNEEHLLKRMELVSANLKQKSYSDTDTPPEKKSRNLSEAVDIRLNLNHEGSGVSSEDISSLSLMVKPVDPDKVLLTKLSDEDMPFLNSSDDMICGSEDPDLSTDSKRDQDAGLQVVDDIVNERLKNLSDNMNFAVPLQSGLNTSSLNGEQSGLHLITGFQGVENSISVSNSTVISNNITENKPAVSVSSMDLISSYSIPSLSSTGTHNVNSEPSNELNLEPVTSQNMLGSFEIGLSSLSTFDALQSQSSNVPHSEDSFLESLSSFETPLTQSCSSASAPVSSFDDGVMKNSSMLQLESGTTDSPRPPPKFISTFTPAVTNDKTTSISTAQRLQRSYLELDSGLDDGLDLDFEAFTQELGMNRNSSS
ncbi:uncharacterized protein LOC117646741 isoform X2 [Thrips palmi]|uniref:Uncharacterized protein LOC117646741 isoform X2 n=1 Tax=Thrips palmi TaxID=161013 RepID=A0A6P8YV04_THRPL|nr:uncharacterized protein LOC117646741 isoform X2 [Thrips palmi]